MNDFSTAGVVAPSPALRAAVAAVLQTEGERRTTEYLRISRNSVNKLAAGAPCRVGTLVVAALMLGLQDEVTALTRRGDQ